MKTRKFTAMLLALAMVLSLCCVSVLAADTSVTYGGVTLGFGDPTHEPTWPENAMGLEGSNGTYTAVYEGSDAAYYYRPGRACGRRGCSGCSRAALSMGNAFRVCRVAGILFSGRLGRHMGSCLALRYTASMDGLVLAALD